MCMNFNPTGNTHLTEAVDIDFVHLHHKQEKGRRKTTHIVWLDYYKCP